MGYLFTFELSVLLLALGAAAASADGANAACPRWATGVPIPREHSDDACDLIAQNHPARRKLEHDRRSLALSSGQLHELEDERTWVCPEDDDGLPSAEDAGAPPPPALIGATTRWMLRNDSSNSVSVALVDPARNNTEVSAMNPKVHPAHHDPRAVLRPGQRAVVDTTYGAVLHVRELLRVGDEMAPGRVLVRHRTGPLAVGKHFLADAANNDDAVDDAVDSSVPDQGGVEPTDERVSTPTPDGGTSTKRVEKAHQETETSQGPQYNRDEALQQRVSEPLGWRMCNSIDKLFVNRSGRPLDVYYAGAADVETKRVGGGPTRTGRSAAADCDVQWISRLGTDAAPRRHFLASPETTMFGESTYLGHRFVAALQSDPSVVVQEIVIERTEVGDCPRERKDRANADSKTSVAAEVRRGAGEEEGLNKTWLLEEYADVVSSNFTNSESHAAFIKAEFELAVPERSHQNETLVGLLGTASFL